MGQLCELDVLCHNTIYQTRGGGGRRRGREREKVNPTDCLRKEAVQHSPLPAKWSPCLVSGVEP